MPDHVAPGGPPIPCLIERGFAACPICDRITPGALTYSEAYHRLFRPEDFDEPPRDEPIPAVAPVAPNLVAAHFANIAKVKACPSWEATSTCGCGMNRCRAGKGRPEDNAVSYNDCFICLDLLDSKNRDPAP